jgi:3,4-dihydroxy-2-butanone 4-phosphate synthase
MAAQAGDVVGALNAFKNGAQILLVDDLDGSLQCNLVMAAEHASPQGLAFMIRHSAGVVHACLDKERLEAFGLHPASSSSGPGADVFVSTNFMPGVTTGVSAKDRAATLRALCDTSNPASAFSKPGNIVPLSAMPGGVLDRLRHCEACYDLCRCSDLQLVGVMAELMNEDGTMCSRVDADLFSKKHSILIVSAQQLFDIGRLPRWSLRQAALFTWRP